MTVHLAWASHQFTPDECSALAGPWEEVRAIAPGVLLIESNEPLSPVYHALKWSLPDGAALIVTPVTERPKSAEWLPAPPRGCGTGSRRLAETSP